MGRTYSHTQETWTVMGQCEVFVRKLGRSIDGTRSGAVSIDEVSTLNHEIFDLLLSALRIETAM